MSDAEHRVVLHAVRLRSLAGPESIAERTGCTVDAVRSVLDDARARGFVVERTGRMTGWSLTAAGREHGLRLLAAELDERGARPAVERAYAAFVGVNQRFLEVCTAWQLRGEGEVNDHSDPEHDAAVLAQLQPLHRVVVEDVTEAAGAVLERFAGYPARFEHALARLTAGDLDWFTRPLIDSYHTVWFELHDDLLATLGLDREAERRAARNRPSEEPVHATSTGRGQTGGVGTTAGTAVEE